MHFCKRLGKSSTARLMTSCGILFHAATKLFFSASIDWWGFEHASASKMLQMLKSITFKSSEFGGQSPLSLFELMSTSMNSGTLSRIKFWVSSALCDGAPSWTNENIFWAKTALARDEIVGACQRRFAPMAYNVFCTGAPTAYLSLTVFFACANGVWAPKRKIENAKLETQKFLRCLDFCRTYQREKT